MTHHKEQFVTGSYKIRTQLTLNKSKTRQEKLLSFDIKDDAAKQSVKCCFSCGCFWKKHALAEKHFKECNKKAEELEVCKSLCQDMTADPSEQTAEARIAALEKELAETKKLTQLAEEKALKYKNRAFERDLFEERYETLVEAVKATLPRDCRYALENYLTMEMCEIHNTNWREILDVYSNVDYERTVKEDKPAYVIPQAPPQVTQPPCNLIVETKIEPKVEIPDITLPLEDDENDDYDDDPDGLYFICRKCKDYVYETKPAIKICKYCQ
jgi:hypothetical protein